MNPSVSAQGIVLYFLFLLGGTMFKKKYLLISAKILLTLAFIFAGCSKTNDFGGGKAPQGGVDLIILHTNDMHSFFAGTDKDGKACLKEDTCYGGYGRVAQAIKDIKKGHNNVLALDAGDQMQGTLFYAVNKIPMIAEIEKQMPYDAVTLGNHEWDEGCKNLFGLLEEENYPVVAANLTPEKGCPLLGGKYAPYIVRNIRGTKVGIIGIANDNVVETGKACKNTKFSDTVTTTANMIRTLEAEGVHIIIALTHIGLPEDRKLARSVDGIDIIVGGHSHSYIGPGSAEGPYPIVETSPSGKPVLVVTAKRAAKYLGELEVQFDADGIPVGWQGGPKELRPQDPVDPVIRDITARYRNTLEKFLAIKVGENNLDFPDGMDACRIGECLSGLVTADAFLEYGRPYGAVAAIMNGGGLRGGFPKGEITQGDILNIHPFSNMVIVKEYTGEQLMEALEHSVETNDNLHLLQPSGFTYTVNMNAPKGHRIVKAEIQGRDGRMHSLKVREKYKIALINFLADGGDGFSMLKEGRDIPSALAVDRDVVEKYVREHTPLAVSKTDRIKFLNK